MVHVNIPRDTIHLSLVPPCLGSCAYHALGGYGAFRGRGWSDYILIVPLLDEKMAGFWIGAECGSGSQSLA